MFKIVSTLVAVSMVLPLAIMAQAPGRHPGYVHALGDLRFARAVLERHEGWGPVAADQQRAAAEIDRAIQELSHAAMADGRNPNEHPPIDMHWEPRDRMHRAMDALGQAREAISREEDNPGARGWRDRAMRHIDMAQRVLGHAMDRWH